MAGDDKEKNDTPSASVSGLPPKVERALERARLLAKADRERTAGRWLAALPASIAVVFLLLLMPRATVPDAIPLPRVDNRVVDAIARSDDARAAVAEAARLPSDVLALGSAVRAFNAAEARRGDEVEMIEARRRLESALRDLRPRPSLEDELLSLRAVQLRRYLDSISRWQATGETSSDYEELSSAFIQRATEAGWVGSDRRVLLTEMQRRGAFKKVWNTLVGVDAKARFALALDEQRALYVFYIEHPHPADSLRAPLESQRRSATTTEDCSRANAEEHRQMELWRIDKIKKLGSIDPAYPVAYALGVAYYRAGRYDLSAEAFTEFIGAHPDGPYALRAKNHLKAALVAGNAL